VNGVLDIVWDIIPSFVTSNHFWGFEILERSLCFIVFFVMQMFWFPMFWAWIPMLLQVNQFLNHQKSN